MSLKDTVLKYTQENNIKKEYSQNEKIKLIQKELEKFTDDFWEEQLDVLGGGKGGPPAGDCG